MTLVAERNTLARALADCEPGAFPGSKAYRAESVAMKALGAFDLAHPEILGIVRAMREESTEDDMG